jgi:hypothetical protein
MRIDMLGVPEGWEHVIFRGAPWVPSCTLFYLAKDELVGAFAFNRPEDLPPAERLMRAHAALDMRALLDNGISLGALVLRHCA